MGGCTRNTLHLQPNSYQTLSSQTASERKGCNLQWFTDFALEAEALTILHVPYSLDNGPNQPHPPEPSSSVDD